ncbi:uncharacterized protein C11orf16 homolog [Carlito syrichta]|uniref:Uncharacterized protein C11orf16 homolog n=1 Tax=Carlito syrichta TaxID=1868482 RepID=A0A3Q0DT70_CARSF|nr:uncharacterized protein C11orf16 homolog [Carlito syrichta]
MESSTGPRMPLPKYCSVATSLQTLGWDRAVPCWDLSFACPFGLQAPWLTRHNPLTRYASQHPCLLIADPAWQRPGWLGRVGDAADTRVLARRGPDGFYYRAQIKAAPELERQGVLLVEFEAPFVTGPKLPVQQQCIVLEEDVIQHSTSVEYSLQPGDKVLAPWEPDQQRYGPGTVLLGSNTRGNRQRASKEEEITIHFWNGKTAKVPLGGVWWVPPAIWKKAVERLYKPSAREHPRPLLWAPCCFLPGSVPGCLTNGLPLGTPFLCPPCYPCTCCQLLCQSYLCGCPLAGPSWWPLASTSEGTVREHPELKLEPTAQLLPLEGPREKEVAKHAPTAVSSSSSSSSEDLEKGLEMGSPQRPMVNSAVNTDPLVLEESARQRGLHQPVWRYWRTNGPEPQPGMPGTRCGNIWKEKDNKQERVQTVAMGTPKELVLEVISMKLPQTLPESAEHRKQVRALQHIKGTRIPLSLKALRI